MMRCPRCNEAFRLTWGGYVTSPTGKFACPACGTGLKRKHKWYYFPLLLAGCCFIGAPLALLGYRQYGEVGAVAGWALGALVSGVPIDKILEGNISRLAEVEKKRGQEPGKEPPGPATPDADND